MSETAPRRSIVWSRQKLDELDALLKELQASAEKMSGDAKAEAATQLDRIRTSREAFKQYIQMIEAEASKAASADFSKSRHALKMAHADIEQQWVEAGLAFQSFLAAASDDAELARKVLLSRAKAERDALEASLDQMTKDTVDAIAEARNDFDDALDRLSHEADRLEAKATDVSIAGKESWRAIRQGIKDAHAVHTRTARAVAETLDRLR